MIPLKTLGKPVLLLSAAILTFSAHAAFAGVGVNVNINVGEPQRQVVVAPPPPVYVAPPAYAPPVEPITVEQDIQFVYPDSLGFYVAVGVPYDLFYMDSSYFLFRDGRWLRAPSSRGPWVAQRYRDLPRPLRRQRLERIRECRTREYVIYNRDRDHYRGRQFRSDKEQWKAQHREAKERRKEDKRFEKEQRKEEKRFEKEDRRFEKEQRKEEKRFEKEERRDRREGRGD